MILISVASLSAQDNNKFKVGDKVPDFKMPYATAEKVVFEGISSAELNGKKYLLAFYPADWSGGCTKEVCTFRDQFNEFDSLGIEILPISTDLVFSHHEWAKHHKLQFKLLADHTREFGKKLGVYMPDNGMYQRSVFVVDEKGYFSYIDYDYSVADDKDLNSLKDALKK